jgi:hypothetical protein
VFPERRRVFSAYRETRTKTRKTIYSGGQDLDPPQKRGRVPSSVPDPQPDPDGFEPPGSGALFYFYGSGSGSFHPQAKKVRKTIIFVGVLKVTNKKSRIRRQIRESKVWIQIRANMARIRNTGS